MPAAASPRVFLSFANEDAHTAERLRPLLKLAGFGPWRDSQMLPDGESRQTALETAIASSDFVIALLSRSSRGGRQEPELRAAVGRSHGEADAARPVVLPCTLVPATDLAFHEVLPDVLKRSHVLDLGDFDVGWPRLYESLYKAARVSGFRMPRLLRAVPRSDLDRAAVARMIVEKGFFSLTMNHDGGALDADFHLAPDGMVVDDRATGRMWSRGCIQAEDLPMAPLPEADEEVALMMSPSRRSEQQQALVDARQRMKLRMRLAVDEWIADMNRERLGGYDDWRLPTLEEAVSLMSRTMRAGAVYISELFSDHQAIRTADRSAGVQSQFPRLGLGEMPTIWVVTYRDADCWEVAEEARVPRRFVRTDLD
jgi:hypothetical protein